MELFMNLMYILVTSVLVENVVLAKFLGCCPFLGVSKKLDSAVGMSSAVIFVMLMATAVTWPIYTYLLAPQGLDYLQTIVFILVIAALVQLVEFILKKYMKPLYRSLGVYLPLITTNCAVLGCTLLNIENHYGFVESLINALGSGLGFMLAMVLFAGVRSKMESVEFPKSFQGIPITLIAASIVSMSFMGFASVADGIFK
ncbi:MAG: RnfABCDGE type electron transport complex subunit A [Negativibacillus sp.]